MGFPVRNSHEFGETSIVQFSIRDESSYLVTFPNSITVCIYGSFADNQFAKNIERENKQIALAYLPVRPLIIGTKSRLVKSNHIDTVLDIHRRLRASTSVAVNWGGFTFGC